MRYYSFSSFNLAISDLRFDFIDCTRFGLKRLERRMLPSPANRTIDMRLQSTLPEEAYPTSCYPNSQDPLPTVRFFLVAV